MAAAESDLGNHVVVTSAPNTSARRRRYVALKTNIFTDNDWVRFGCSTFEAHGFEVRPLELLFEYSGNVASLERKNFRSSASAVRLTEPKELLRELDNLGPDDVIMSEVSLIPRRAWIHRAMSARQLKYGVIDAAAFQGAYLEYWGTARSLRELWHLKFADFRSFVRRALRGLGVVFRPSTSYFKIIPPAWWIRAGTCHPIINHHQVKKWRAKLVRVHSQDYDKHLLLGDDPEEVFPGQKSHRYIVFLDQAFADHPDYQMFDNKSAGKSHPVTAERYSASMRRLFDILENQTGAEVVVAAHQKANYDPDDNPFGRRLFYGQTAALAKYACMAVCSVTTSVSYAVINRIPVLFVTTDEIEAHKPILGDILRMASSLRQGRINVDEVSDGGRIELPVVRDDVYDRYMRRFIKEPDVPDAPLWETVIKEILDTSEMAEQADGEPAHQT